MRWTLPLLLTSAAAFAQTAPPEFANELEAQWVPLVQAKKMDQAKALCSGWVAGKDAREQVEGHKCLGELIMARGDAAGALAEIETAIRLAPADPGAHESKLQVLMWSRKFSEMPAALETAIKDCGDKGLELWIDFSAHLLDDERYEEGLAFTSILDKHFPKDFRVQADMGALLAASHKREEALPYLKRAVALKPDDALDNWNLGRLYDEMGKAQLADAQFKKAIALEKEAERKQEYHCLYAEFLKKRRKPGAAAYEKKNCPNGAPEDD